MLAVILIYGCVTATWAQDINVTASVDRTSLAINETFTLSVKIDGSNAGDPQLPKMDAFAALRGTNSSQSFQLINGRMSASKTIHYSFIARQTGQFEIGAVKVAANGKTFRSQPILIEIVKSSQTRQQNSRKQQGRTRQQQSSSATRSNDQLLYLQVDVDRKRVYQNEPVVVSYKIYTARTITNYSVSKLPNFRDFWVEEFPLPRQPKTYNKVVNGQRYLVAEIKRTALFPQTSGKKTLEPMTIQCEIKIPRQRQRRDFFDSFFDASQRVKKVVSAKPVSIEILPLPTTGKPLNFEGTVGKYTLRATVNRRNVKANEAITLKLIVSGQGNIKTLPTPRLDLSSIFEVYDPKITQEISHSNNTISGKKVWEYVIVPRISGQHKLKPFSLPYFNPTTKKYQIARTQSITLHIAEGESEYAAASGAFSKEEVKLLGKDIRFIALTASPLKNIGAKNYTASWFLVLFIIPIVGFAGVLFYQRHQEKMMTNVAYARGRRATRMASKQLQQAKKFLTTENSKEFYAEIQRALNGFLGNKFNIAEAGLVTDQIEKLLTGKNVSEDLIVQVKECLSVCDFQRFSSSNGNGQDMKAFYDKVRDVVEGLEETL